MSVTVKRVAVGVPPRGRSGSLLRKRSDDSYDVYWGDDDATAVAVAEDLAEHEADTANPHAVTKTQVGLQYADNTSDVNKPVSTAMQTALDLCELLSRKGQANGYAPLDGSSKISSTYLPAYVDDVIEAANYAALPVTGSTGVIYVTLDTNLSYRWSGSAYVQIDHGDVTAVAALTGNISAAALKTALAIAVADITDATANGRSLISAADYAAMRVLLSLGTAALLNVGTSASQIVQLDGTAKLPAVDGSQLTNLPASTVASQAEAEAGTDNTKSMTALRTNQAIAAWGHGPNVILEERQSSGTAGGTFTSGAWRTRLLNTAVRNVNSLATLASNQVQLPAGTYLFEWSAPGSIVDNHQTRVQNITDTSTVGVGTSEFASVAGAGQMTRSVGSATVTIAGTKTFELQHLCTTTRATNGFGLAMSGGVTEVYARLEITKIA